MCIVLHIYSWFFLVNCVSRMRTDPEPWGHKSKMKRRKTEGSLRTRNYSIKPPPSSGRKGKGKTKTGFNSKSLKFEPGNPPLAKHAMLWIV